MDAEGTERHQEPPPLPDPPRPRRGRSALAAVVAGLVLLGGGIGIGWVLSRGGTAASTRSPIEAAPQTLPSTGRADRALDVQAIADRVDPALVDINTVLDPGSLAGGTGGRSGLPTERAAGTGMVLTSTGEVLTNNHVIQGATSITVTVVGRSGSFVAKVVGADPKADVALLQMEGVSGLPTVTLADSSTSTVGQEVVAIGNALGQGGSPTVTDGTISGLNRSITVGGGSGGTEHLSGLIQTDAPISPGDSGGPLVNVSGQVVGMITAGATGGQRQRVSSVGYAIPATSALAVVNQIRTGHGSSTIIIGQPGFLGVEVQSLDPTVAAQLGLKVSSGALVVAVIPGTPAAVAGMSRYAVITAIDGRPIASADALGPAIRGHRPGEELRVTWVDRAGGTHTATVRLISGPAV